MPTAHQACLAVVLLAFALTWLKTGRTAFYWFARLLLVLDAMSEATWTAAGPSWRVWRAHFRAQLRKVEA